MQKRLKMQIAPTVPPRLGAGEAAAGDLEADWNYLRANLDHPSHLSVNRLVGGLAAWLLRRLQPHQPPAPQLAMLARIPLGPRQGLALVEAEGVHMLVGTSADAPLTFFPLPSGWEGAGSSAGPDDGAAWLHAGQLSGSAVARLRRLAAQSRAASRLAAQAGIDSAQPGLAPPARAGRRTAPNGRISW